MPQISYIKYTDVLEARRYDAEYFKPEYLEVFNNKNHIKFETLNHIAKVSDGDHAKFPDNQKSEVRYLRAKDIKDNFLLNDDPVFVSKDYFSKQKRSHIKGLNILMSIMGSIGDITITPESFETCLANRAICIIKDIKINPYYLFAYMTSRVADKNIQRIKKGGIQERINLELLNEIKIPILSEFFQLQIEEIVKLAYQKQTQSKQLYREAEELLLAELGLLDYEIKHSLCFTTTKNEVSESHRYDTEYFQPKYAEIIKKIEEYEGGWDLVKNQFEQNTILSKKDKDYYNYVEISDVNISNGEITPNKVDVKDIPANGKRKLFKNDLLISKVRPYRGAISFIDFEIDNLIGSGAFTVLQEKTEYNKEVLMIFLKTKFIKELLLRYNSGTSYPVIKDEDILNLPIPLIKSSIQKQIADKVQESHRLRKESKDLLEEAKRKVEEEIEKSE
jgi:type I restriction enzyme S subunit